MKNILITGASRGLGLEFVNQYLRKGERIFACNRNPEKYSELKELKSEYQDKLTLINLDVTNQKSRNEAFEEISKITNQIDILINNAGIRFGGEKYCDELGKLEKEDFGKIYQVNTVAPLMIVEKFLPLLKAGNDTKIINISSSSGCITRRTSKRGGYSYASSKAALNMVTKALSVDLEEYNITVISLHPGWVKTTMELTVNAPLVPEESVTGMINLIANLRIKETGKFFDWQGNEMPW
ncbi:MAG: SDR family oxidoreductase [Candidatus Heimdallarchaeota archaeon]|nr:SDR family oxidoreductase [Candidatus Heimdallarchaeota archaeon]